MSSDRAAAHKTPQKARTEKALRALKRDNISTETSWMLLHESHVTICNQKSGEGPSGTVNLSRAEFDKFVRWYTTGRAR